MSRADTDTAPIRSDKGVAPVTLSCHGAGMGQPGGFAHEVRRSGEIVITHHGSTAAVLRGARAAEFLDEVETDPQQVMARWTGNYKHGNERTAKNHPRNRYRR